MISLISIGVQYLQKVVFSFEEGSNRQNHTSSGLDYPITSFPSKIFDSLPEFHPLTIFEKS